MSQYIRHGRGAVRPYLHGPMALLSFVEQVFGEVEVERHEFGPQSVHSELQLGDSVIVIEAGELPDDAAACTNSVYVYVEDVDAAWDRAMRLDAEPISPPADKPYGERQAGFRDAAGNTWWVAQYLG